MEINFNEFNNQNLDLYIQGYQMNNIGNFIKIVRSLSDQTTRPDTLQNLLKSYENYQSEQAQIKPTYFLFYKNGFIAASAVASLKVLIILIGLTLGSVVARVRQKTGSKLFCKLGSKKSKLEFDAIQR